MTNKERIHAMNLLRLAIELAGDGFMQPFTDKEYELMYQFLNEIQNELV